MPDKAREGLPDVTRALAARAMSVRDRLLTLAHRPSEQVNYNTLLRRYLQERLLWRVARSEHRNDFVLKGGLRMIGAGFTWARATKDIDFLGHGDPGLMRLEAVFRDICKGNAMECQLEDGVRFDPESIQVRPIMEEAEYDGVRITLVAFLGTVREPMHIDVGFGDAMTPGPTVIRFPTLLDGMTAPELLAYNDETTVAEKFETMVRRGLANSRMKDFYDLYRFARTVPFEGRSLSQALQRTFERRGTFFTAVPVVFTAGFAEDNGKATQWRAFRRSLGQASAEVPEQFGEAVSIVHSLIEPAHDACRDGSPFTNHWNPSLGRWQNTKG